jgi:hypothetical protein
MVVLVHGCGHGQRVVARAGVYLAELAEAAATAKARLSELATARYHNECSAVAAAVAVLRAAAVAETELPHQLLLVGDELVEDVGTLALEPNVPPPPPPALEPDPALGVLSCRQLWLVAHHFTSAAKGGLVAVEDAAALMGRVGAEDGGRGLPAPWTHAPMNTLMKRYDPHHTGFLDWRELLTSLAVAAFPVLATATLLQLGESVKELARVDADGDGLVSLVELQQAKVWFQMANRGQPFDRPAHLKRALFEAHAVEHVPTGDRRVEYIPLLLFLATADTLVRLPLSLTLQAWARALGSGV